jgi:hypothetical protein
MFLATKVGNFRICIFFRNEIRPNFSPTNQFNSADVKQPNKCIKFYASKPLLAESDFFFFLLFSERQLFEVENQVKYSAGRQI